MITRTPVEKTLTLNAWAGGPATLDVFLQGVNTLPHAVAASMNGHALG